MWFCILLLLPPLLSFAFLSQWASSDLFTPDHTSLPQRTMACECHNPKANLCKVKRRNKMPLWNIILNPLTSDKLINRLFPQCAFNQLPFAAQSKAHALARDAQQQQLHLQLLGNSMCELLASSLFATDKHKCIAAHRFAGLTAISRLVTYSVNSSSSSGNSLRTSC